MTNIRASHCLLASSLLSLGMAVHAAESTLEATLPSANLSAPSQLVAKAFSIIPAVTLRCVGANGVFDFVEEGGDDLLFTIPIGFDGRGYKLSEQPPMDMRCRFIVPEEGQLNEVEL